MIIYLALPFLSNANETGATKKETSIHATRSDTKGSLQDAYSFIVRQIEVGETSEAESFLKEKIETIERTEHPTHPKLIAPLTLLGDTKSAQGELKEALLFYGRAIFVVRVNNGLFAFNQLEIIYKEAESYKRLGDIENTQKREEYAYEVLQRSYPIDDSRRIPGLLRLAQFYDDNYRYLASRVFYRKALLVLIANGRETEIEAIPMHYGIASSYLMERFPPLYVSDARDSRSIGVVPGLDDADLALQYLSVNNFPEGERALQSAVNIATDQIPQDASLVRETTMRLADWHLMWDRPQKANTLFSSVYEDMQSSGLRPQDTFGEPTLIYFPEPKQPSPPPAKQRLTQDKGFVELGFMVKQNGRISRMQTLKTQPEKMMEFQVRRSMREAVFRPAFVDGRVAQSHPHTYTYEFDYFPSSNDLVEKKIVKP